MIRIAQSDRATSRNSPASPSFDFGTRAAWPPADVRSESERYVDRLKAHDVEAFEILVERYTPRLLATAKRFLRNDEDAADVVQDTYLLAYLSIHKFRGLSSIYTWLYRILVNAALMKLRAQSSDRSVSFERMVRDPNWDGAMDPRDVPAKEATCQMSHDEMKAFVRDCIDDLPADYRTIILLRDIEQRDTAETAKLLNVTCGAVKTRLHRARQALRAMIEGAFEGILDPRTAACNLPALVASNEV